MLRLSFQLLVTFLIASHAANCYSQEIQSTYTDLTLPGHWQSGQGFVPAKFGTDINYDPGTGAVVLISAQGGMQSVANISKFFANPSITGKDAAEVMSAATFPIPRAYTEKVSKDLANGIKPPKMSEVKEGEGNPLWFYASQLFDEYRVRAAGGSSVVSEEFSTVRVTKAEQQSVKGGDALLFEVETEKPANDAALKRFHMPPAVKDQRVRFGWVQFATGGIASGQGVLSVGFAVPANSTLTIDEVLTRVAAANIKPL